MILLLQDPNGSTASFPRIRGGDPGDLVHIETETELFPAYAGVIPQLDRPHGRVGAFPRIRGGDPN